MNSLAIVLCATVAMQDPAWVLEKIRAVEDAGIFELRDPVKGDRGVPKSCDLAARTTVTLSSASDATLSVERDRASRSIVVEDVRGLGRSTLACGASDLFFYVNPRSGKLDAYSADRLFRGEDPIVWTRSVDPFVGMAAAGNVMTNASVATAVQVRGELVLVEWFFRKDGSTSFWHAMFEAATGVERGKIGPSDLLLKTNENDPWWILFQGGGNEIVNYVPRSLYRLKLGPPGQGPAAAATIEAMRAVPPTPLPLAIPARSEDPVINHIVALLSPTRTAPGPAIEFCPSVPAQRARYWLGANYDEAVGSRARNILLVYWAAQAKEAPGFNPIDAWFQREIAPREPMTALLARFDPQDDGWIAKYQAALLQLGGPTFERMIADYGNPAVERR